MFDAASICLVILPVIVLYGLALQWGFNLIWFKGPAWLVMPLPAGWSVAPSPSLPGFFQPLIICPLCFYSAFKSSDAPELLPSSFVFGIHLVSFSMRLVCCSSLCFIHFSVFSCVIRHTVHIRSSRVFLVDVSGRFSSCSSGYSSVRLWQTFLYVSLWCSRAFSSYVFFFCVLGVYNQVCLLCSWHTFHCVLLWWFSVLLIVFFVLLCSVMF